MSSALVKRGLELFDEDLTSEIDTEKKKKKKKAADNPMKLISTNKQGIKKELKKLKEKREGHKKQKRIKSLHDEWYKYQSYDKSEDKLNFISKISQLDGPSTESVQQILEQHRGHLSKDKHKEVEEEKEPESVFRDRDFDQFEKEYDFFK